MLQSTKRKTLTTPKSRSHIAMNTYKVDVEVGAILSKMVIATSKAKAIAEAENDLRFIIDEIGCDFIFDINEVKEVTASKVDD